MNKFLQAIKNLDFDSIQELLQKDAKWVSWKEEDGKNALHYLCGLKLSDEPQREARSLRVLELLLSKGMDINSAHQIKDGCGFFPATPLWYAYTRGRNETLYNYLLANGADPEHCMYAIAWYDDVRSAELFKAHGASIDSGTNGDTPFLAAFMWKKFEVANWFLKNGANVNSADLKGNTALFYAIKRKYPPEYIEMLLQYGATYNQANKDGISPRKLAELNRQVKILKLLEGYNAIQ